MVNTTNSDGNSSDATDQGDNYKDEGSTKDEQTGDQKKWNI
jgi:hypothetical protein